MDQSFTIALEAKEIACTRGGRRLFEDLSFTLRAGDTLLLQGPNGSGKTSLMRQIAGLLPLEEGEISAKGAADDAPVTELCHYVGHLNAIKTALSVTENLAFWADYLGGPGKLDTALDSSLETALSAFALDQLGEVPAGLLSAGQKRKLALSRLLASPRPIWLLDEPSVSLDQGSVARLAELLGDHREAGGIAIIATHVPIEVRYTHTLDLIAASPAPGENAA